MKLTIALLFVSLSAFGGSMLDQKPVTTWTLDGTAGSKDRLGLFVHSKIEASKSASNSPRGTVLLTGHPDQVKIASGDRVKCRVSFVKVCTTQYSTEQYRLYKFEGK